MHKLSLNLKAPIAAFAVTLLFLVAQTGAIAADAEKFNRRLGLGMNLGNALEAPKEGAWGLTIKPEYFKTIKSAGFSHVRIPICWSAHAKADAPYTIDPEFLLRVDEVVHEALSNNLMVVIDMHHYQEFEQNPGKHKDRFLSMWEQIAQHFHNASPNLAFEIYNEPGRGLTEEVWNKLLLQALQVIRTSNPDRCVIIGPGQFNSLYSLVALKVPENDHNLIVTIHYYAPFNFTHQGAPWVGPESAKWIGTTWGGDANDRAKLAACLDITKQWREQNMKPIYVGEFGAFSKADVKSRERWTRAVSEAAAARKFSAAYWEFGSGFGAYDIHTNSWHEELLKALIDPWKSVHR